MTHFTGHQLTISAASGFYAALIGFKAPDGSRAEVDITTLTDSYFRRDEGDIVNWNGARIRMNFRPDLNPPIESVKETFTITWKGSVVQSFTGFLSNYSPQEAVLDQRVEVECTISIDGDVTHADESSGA